jgi:hypothetical protein
MDDRFTGSWPSILESAWEELKGWKRSDKLNPENEEEIQCFLYYSMLKKADDANFIKPKYITDKPDKLRFIKGKLEVGNMHFPDFVLGGGELVAEIKFVTGVSNTAGVFKKCKDDISKMLESHPNSKRCFILFNNSANECYLDKHQYNQLQGIDPACKILIYPESLSENPLKERARKIVEDMRRRGVNFSELGRKNAEKAMNKD